MNVKTLFLLSAGVMACSAFSLTVTDVSAQAQRYPWSNFIDIDFTLGDAGADEQFKIDVKASYLDGKHILIARRFVTEPVVKPGTRRITWDIGKDYPGFKADDLRVAVTASPFTNGVDGVYMIIDLAGGKNATKYPVRYSTTPPKHSVNALDACKTTEMWLKRIKCGSFMFCEGDSDPGEFKVNLTKDFYMGIFECTQRQWAQVTGEWPSKFVNPEFRETRPCENIGHTSIRGHFQWPRTKEPTAGSFVGKVRGRSGLATFDLPTEAQWEYANRCGAKNGAHWCYKVDSDNMRYNLPTSNIDYNCDLSGGTMTVGAYAPNVWGIYEMFGNVAELCLDASVGLEALCKYYGALTGLSEAESTYDKVVVDDPEGGPLKNTYSEGHEWKKYESSAESTHIMRGASWYSISGYMTHHSRYSNDSFTSEAKGARFVVTCE